MIFDKNTVPQRLSISNTKPIITFTDKGEIRFNVHSRELFKVKDRVYFRFQLIDGMLHCIAGNHPNAFHAKANGSTHITHGPLVRNIIKAMNLKVEKVSFEVLPALEKRNEGFLQYPLTIFNT